VVFLQQLLDHPVFAADVPDQSQLGLGDHAALSALEGRFRRQTGQAYNLVVKVLGAIVIAEHASVGEDLRAKPALVLVVFVDHPILAQLASHQVEDDAVAQPVMTAQVVQVPPHKSALGTLVGLAAGQAPHDLLSKVT